MRFLKNAAVLTKFQYIKDLNFTFESMRIAINPIKGFKKYGKKNYKMVSKKAFLKTLF